MLPLHKHSTLSKGIAYLEREAKRADRRANSRAPLSQAESELLKFHLLGVDVVQRCGAVDATIMSHHVDPVTGAGEWEAEFRCLHCGSLESDWPAPPEMTGELRRQIEVNPASDPILAQVRCAQCRKPLGTAVELEGLGTWLATWVARGSGWAGTAHLRIV